VASLAPLRERVNPLLRWDEEGDLIEEDDDW
jgi:hypothetical protein